VRHRESVKIPMHNLIGLHQSFHCLKQKALFACIVVVGHRGAIFAQYSAEGTAGNAFCGS